MGRPKTVTDVERRANSRKEISHRVWYLGRVTPALNDADLSAVEHGLAELIANLTTTTEERATQFGSALKGSK